MSLAEQPLGKLARQIPGATAVFYRHQLDFCCGGNKTLREAATERGADADAIAAELQSLPSSADDTASDWSTASSRALIEYIVERYHDVHRAQFPELIRLALKIEQVHGNRPDCPNGLADHLRTMQQELESHMQKEEQVLFPMLQRGEGARAQMPIGVMRIEHEHHGEALRHLTDLTDNLTLPRAACTTWRALYLGLRTFHEDLMQHIHLENNILFDNAAREPANA